MAEQEHWTAPDHVSDLAMRLLTGPVLEYSKIRDWSTADLENVRSWVASLYGRSGDTVSFIDRVLVDRRSAEDKNKAATSGHVCGAAAFAAGKVRAPYLDDSLRYLLKQYDHTLHTTLFENWLQGWDTANLESAGVESPI